MNSYSDFNSEDAVERAIRELVGAGLLHCREGFVQPTRAALLRAAGAARMSIAGRFGENLRRARKDAGLSQEEAGIRSGPRRWDL